MAWLILFFAGVFEVGWAVGLKYTHGFTRLIPSVGTLFVMSVSIYLLSLAVKTIPLGTAYAVWTGIGTVGAVLLGMWVFGEPRVLLRLFFVALIIVGIVGLKISTP